MKTATIQDLEEDAFSLEYEDTLGRRNLMRLDAITYEGAIREARAYLDIDKDDRDPAGEMWVVS